MKSTQQRLKEETTRLVINKYQEKDPLLILEVVAAPRTTIPTLSLHLVMLKALPMLGRLPSTFLEDTD